VWPSGRRFTFRSVSIGWTVSICAASTIDGPTARAGPLRRDVAHRIRADQQSRNLFQFRRDVGGALLFVRRQRRNLRQLDPLGHVRVEMRINERERLRHVGAAGHRRREPGAGGLAPERGGERDDEQRAEEAVSHAGHFSVWLP